MKKIFLSAAVILLMSFGAIAQMKTSPNRGGFIIRGGVNFSNISLTDNGRVDKANSLTSFHAGIGYDVPLSGYFSLQPGLIFTGKGAKTQLGKSWFYPIPTFSKVLPKGFSMFAETQLPKLRQQGGDHSSALLS